MKSDLDTMPYNKEAEQAVLGALLLDPSAYEKIRTMLTPLDFYNEHHRRIYGAFEERYKAGQPVDWLSLLDAMQAQVSTSLLRRALDKCVMSVVTATAVVAHANLVKGATQQRALINTGYRLMEIGQQPTENVDELIVEAQNALTAAGRGRSSLNHDLSRAILDFVALSSHALPERTRHVPWLTEGGIVMVYGPRGVGKTFFTLSLAIALTSGGTFLRWQVTNPVSVMYLDGEMSLHDLRTRTTRLTASTRKAQLYFLSGEVVYQTLEKDLVLTGETMREAVTNYLDQHPEIRVLILDNISCLFPGINEDKKQDWEPIQAWLIRLRHRGVSVVLAHHAGKGGEQRGTSGREDALDAVLRLSWPPDYNPQEGCHFELRFTKSRAIKGEDVAPLDVKLGDTDGALQWTFKTLEESKLDQVKQLLADGIASVKDIAEQVGITKGYASKLKRKAQAEGDTE